MALAVLASGEVGRLGDADPLDFVLLGAIGCGSYLAFYRALAIAVIPIVMGVAVLHERPGRVQWLGVALVLAGLVLLGVVS